MHAVSASSMLAATYVPFNNSWKPTQRLDSSVRRRNNTFVGRSARRAAYGAVCTLIRTPVSVLSPCSRLLDRSADSPCGVVLRPPTVRPFQPLAPVEKGGYSLSRGRPSVSVSVALRQTTIQISACSWEASSEKASPVHLDPVRRRALSTRITRSRISSSSEGATTLRAAVCLIEFWSYGSYRALLALRMR